MNAAARWLRARLPELGIVVLGIALRASLARFYDVSQGYDFSAHEGYIRFVLDHHAIPPFDFNADSYNPPLFYALAALVLKLGLSIQAVGVISIVASSLQLLLVWLGAELYLPSARLARVATLALAVVVPAGVHIAGFASNHALSDLFCVGTIVLLPQVMRRRGRGALRWAAGAGLCLGLALLTKISGATVAAAFVLAVAIALMRARPGDDAARGLLPQAVLFVAVMSVVCGWHYVRHKVLYGKYVLTFYDPFVELDETYKTPYLDRRTIGYVVSWDDAIYRQPFWSAGTKPNPRFWPVLVATTFADYYNFGFVPPPPAGAPHATFNGRPMRTTAVGLARASVVGGTILAALAVLAGALAARRFWRRGDDGRFVLLLVPLVAVAAQLHFAVQYPADSMGPIKGAYLQFIAPVLCALSGLAISTAWRRRGLGRVVALAGIASIALVAAYTVYARVVVPLSS